MHTRLTLTLLLILLAAVIAAAAIFFLLTRPQPPAPSAQPLPARAAQPGRAAPNLTLIAESITGTVTSQLVSADVYLNPTGGLRSGALLYQGVTHFQVTVPMDGSAEIRVAAPGYKPWGDG